jgi:hypothetical protein
LIDTQAISSNEKSLPMVMMGKNNLGRITQPELIAFIQANSTEEVLMAVEAKNVTGIYAFYLPTIFIYLKSLRRNVIDKITGWSEQ